MRRSPSVLSVVISGLFYTQRKRGFLLVEVKACLMVIQTFQRIQACLEKLGISFMLVDILSVTLLLC